MKAILADVHALERMINEERFETGISRIGAEQEMFLLDRSGRAWNGASQMMQALNHKQFTYELAQFNLEANLEPRVFGGKCLSAMEAELCDLLQLARKTAAELGGGIVLCGILPTLRRSDLSLALLLVAANAFAPSTVSRRGVSMSAVAAIAIGGRSRQQRQLGRRR